MSCIVPDQRYYSSATGSFTTPDPSGMRAAKPKNPGSWNRYAYVTGDPVNHRDRRGLWEDRCDDDGVCESGSPYWEDTCNVWYCGEVPRCSPGLLAYFASGPIGGECVDDPDAGTDPPPQIPCEIDAGTIDSYIAKTPIYGNSRLSKPLAGMGQAFIDAALSWDVNPGVLVAIAFQESHWGYDQRNSGTNNAFGLLHADGTFLTFDSWQAGIYSAALSVDSAYNRGNRSVSDLYSGVKGAYCTHAGCSDAISSIERRTRALGEDPDYLGFDCTMNRDGVLVKKQ